MINNTSILNAIGIVGLELYKFGKITSIPFENENVKTPFDVLINNQKSGLHTLFLLDLHPEEDRYMTVNQALEYLIKQGLDKNALAIGCAAIGSKPEIKFSRANLLLKHKFKKTPQCLIIPGKLHFMEEEALDMWK